MQIKDHIFLILKVKETLLTTHEHKGSLEIKKGCGGVDFCPKATTVRPCTKATEAEPRTKVQPRAQLTEPLCNHWQKHPTPHATSSLTGFLTPS